MKHITSPQNPYIKSLVQLVFKARSRKELGLFVAEGLREVALALKNGYEAEALLFDPKLTTEATVEALAKEAQFPPKDLVAVSPEVFEKIAYRSSVANVAAVFQSKQLDLEELTLPDHPLVLVVEQVEKPGNLGALLRTADAAGVSAVLLCDPLGDLFNPNVIRASLGAIFTVPVAVCTSEAAHVFLKKNNITILATYLEAAKSLYVSDLNRPVALVLGAEATGISEFWIQNADERIIIPMSGQVDSLNVSAAAAVALFEAVRQRSKEIGN